MIAGVPRDAWAGALIGLLGLGVAVEGWSYDTGTLTEMGPGFFPVALGIILMTVGLLIALTAGAAEEAPPPASLRGFVAIAFGVLLFILLAQHGGLVPATFAAVFVSALGDRDATLHGSVVLALGVTVAGVGLFHYALGLQLPLFAWGAG